MNLAPLPISPRGVAQWLAPLLLLMAIGCGGGSRSSSSPTDGVTPPSSTAPRVSSFYPGTISPGGPSAFLSLTGANFNTSSVVLVNGVAHSTEFVSSTQVTTHLSETDIQFTRMLSIEVRNQTPLVETSPIRNYSVQIPSNPAIDFKSLKLVANDIAYDRTSNLVWASISSASPDLPSTIVAIDPRTTSIIKTFPMDLEANLLAVSSDGSQLYASFLGTPMIRGYALPNFLKNAEWTLGSSIYYHNEPFDAVGMAIAPGQPQTLAVIKGLLRLSVTGVGGITIYDNGTARTNSTPVWDPTCRALTWGPNSNTLYAVDNESTGFDFINLTVDAQGLATWTNYPNTVNGFGFAIKYEPSQHLIYSGDGTIFNPDTAMKVGKVFGYGWVETDPENGAIYMISQDLVEAIENRCHIASYALTNRTQLGLNYMYNIFGSPRKVLTWGKGNICFNTLGGRIYFLSGGLTQ